MDEYITAKEAAIVLGFSSGYVTKLCREGVFDLATRQEGGRREWKIPKVAVEYYKQKKEGRKK